MLVNLRLYTAQHHYLTETDNSPFILIHLLRHLESFPCRVPDNSDIELQGNHHQ